ncbi:hypothetical protein SDC9_130431 [bioreactor metagenome]|uniref:Uncharacterized protein n=1 Tax=bioreactor metagenome TaxID=1076179 RepID=A0A645D2I0_9ZZZZ
MSKVQITSRISRDKFNIDSIVFVLAITVGNTVVDNLRNNANQGILFHKKINETRTSDFNFI